MGVATTSVISPATVSSTRYTVLLCSSECPKREEQINKVVDVVHLLVRMKCGNNNLLLLVSPTVNIVEDTMDLYIMKKRTYSLIIAKKEVIRNLQ